jgi:GNAT superfamily N-acetyltransferase
LKCHNLAENDDVHGGSAQTERLIGELMSIPVVPSPTSVARHCDRIARRLSMHRSDGEVVSAPGGWACLRTGDDAAESSEKAINRVYWLTLDRPLRRPEVRCMLDILQHNGARRAVVRVSDLACGDEAESELIRVGARRIIEARRVAMARSAVSRSPIRPSAFRVRSVTKDEVEPLTRSIAGWYSEDGAAALSRLVKQGVAELHCVYDDDVAVGVGALIMDRDESGTGWAYLGWAGTNPAFRGQGAQALLIASRVSRAAELGASWCVSETATNNPTSLNNLRRFGFAPSAVWNHYLWENPTLR